MKRFIILLAFALGLVATDSFAGPCVVNTPRTTQTCPNDLVWTAPTTDATHDLAAQYFVQRSNSPTGTFIDIATVNAPTVAFTDTVTTDAGGQTYCYRVVSGNTAGKDGPSNVACRTTPVIPGALPNPVPNVQVSTLSNDQIEIRWMNRTDSNRTGYQFERSGNNQVRLVEFASNDSSGIDSGLRPRTWYRYRGRALGDAGASAWSSGVWARTLR